MTTRTRRELVTFAEPFALRGAPGPHPAGTYAVETDEELVEGLSFPAYRRVATAIYIPLFCGSLSGSLYPIEPGELSLIAAMERQRG
jgi:hypothetical protein